ncbi:MAG TPA: hypothetical protein VJ875_11390 [Pyrinomonadaceae bacterium]|nr:hypothetical protein [Pyrinomonadaceae bacterium]
MSSQSKIISAFKGLYVALSSLAAYLSSSLIKERLIPEQLEVIGTVGTFFILIALLLTIIYWSNLSSRLTKFILVTIIALCLLTFIQIQYVVTANVGSPNQVGVAPEHNFLIGFRLTAYGKDRAKIVLENGQMLGENQPEKVYIENLGYDLIPLWYGNSYKFMAVAYTLLYMLFVVSIVLTFGGILQRGGDAAVQAWAAQAPTQPATSAPSAQPNRAAQVPTQSAAPAQPNGPATETQNASPAESTGQPR